MPDFRNVGFLTGVLLLFVGAMMLLPLGVSYCYGDGDSNAIIWSMIFTVVTGIALLFLRRKKKEPGLREGFAVVTFSWVAAALAGALPFYLSGAIPTFTDSLFESMSGFTTTGASILGPHNPIENIPHGIANNRYARPQKMQGCLSQ